MQDYSSSVRCSGPSCTHTFPDGETLTYDLSSPPTSVVSTSLLTRNGITIRTINDAFVTDSGRSMHVGVIRSVLHNSDFGSGYQYRSENYRLLRRFDKVEHFHRGFDGFPAVGQRNMARDGDRSH